MKWFIIVIVILLTLGCNEPDAISTEDKQKVIKRGSIRGTIELSSAVEVSNLKIISPIESIGFSQNSLLMESGTKRKYTYEIDIVEGEPQYIYVSDLVGDNIYEILYYHPDYDEVDINRVSTARSILMRGSWLYELNDEGRSTAYGKIIDGLNNPESRTRKESLLGAVNLLYPNNQNYIDNELSEIFQIVRDSELFERFPNTSRVHIEHDYELFNIIPGPGQISVSNEGFNRYKDIPCGVDYMIYISQGGILEDSIMIEGGNLTVDYEKLQSGGKYKANKTSTVVKLESDSKYQIQITNGIQHSDMDNPEAEYHEYILIRNLNKAFKPYFVNMLGLDVNVYDVNLLSNIHRTLARSIYNVSNQVEQSADLVKIYTTSMRNFREQIIDHINKSRMVLNEDYVELSFDLANKIFEKTYTLYSYAINDLAKNDNLSLYLKTIGEKVCKDSDYLKRGYHPQNLWELENLRVGQDIQKHEMYSIGYFHDLKWLYLPERSSIPYDIHYQSNLIRLVCSYSWMPYTIGHLDSLRHLEVEGGYIHDSISDLQNLKTLKIDGGYEGVRIPESISKVKSITDLELEDIEKLEKFEYPYTELVNLERLVLKGKNLKQISSEIVNLTQLRYLEIKHHSLSNLPEEIFNLPNLERVVITKNQLLNINQIKAQFESKGVVFLDN